MTKKFKCKKGFTLIELMVVIVIMGILVMIGISTFISSQKRGRDSRRKSDVTNIALVLETYYNDKGKYPTGNSAGQMVGCFPDDATACTWGGAFKDKNSTVYMMVLPKDPRDPSQQYYYVSSGGYFQLYALLENTFDVDVHRNASDVAQSYVGTICGSSKLCNYAVTSSNVSATDYSHALTPP
ncbi:prepilin-type N-terminal cleavage/methylation domain-containing protein [Patescibacteria group bacterium]|nr:prepilin-type N-terminal cleavage/methylation domain-containing protein [Patescibacteria group bacterium]MBU1472906.1 prepilin-type N-terminal cleavage/methylation domain-containing protein [Patescibacteria group bacterium]MBU2460316.1 prepilin-type N-terminal cleavage/methylation domain-containing protein [Patescibacteria group bacterium]